MKRHTKPMTRKQSIERAEVETVSHNIDKLIEMIEQYSHVSNTLLEDLIKLKAKLGNQYAGKSGEYDVE